MDTKYSSLFSQLLYCHFVDFDDPVFCYIHVSGKRKRNRRSSKGSGQLNSDRLNRVQSNIRDSDEEANHCFVSFDKNLLAGFIEQAIVEKIYG